VKKSNLEEVKLNVDHVPVMLESVLEFLQPLQSGVFVDGTFGRGGYTTAILEKGNAEVIAIDKDHEAITYGQALLLKYRERLRIVEGSFGCLDQIVRDQGLDFVDGVVLDLGVSSPQILNSERGFSFQLDGPLDMRMGSKGLTAGELVNNSSERELADIIWQFGQDRHAKKIARAIIQARIIGEIKTTSQLAKIVKRAVKVDYKRINPATKTFQALRIVVNDEIDQLKKVLSAAEKIPKPGGRLSWFASTLLKIKIVKSY
jgi:S-adenosyl-methyltransferase MraW